MKQITIITENPAGVFSRVTTAMADAGINIESFDAENVEEHGIVTLTVDRYQEALAALRDAGIPAIGEETILIRLPDEPGALAKISRRFEEADIRLRSVRILRRSGGWGIVALSAERSDDALALVQDVLVS